MGEVDFVTGRVLISWCFLISQGEAGFISFEWIEYFFRCHEAVIQVSKVPGSDGTLILDHDDTVSFPVKQTFQK